jgi:hypothetical protein
VTEVNIVLVSGPIGVEVVCFDNAGAVTGSVGASTDDDDAEATETAAAA